MHRSSKSILTGLLLITFLLPGCFTPVLVDYDREAALKFDSYKCFVIDTSEEQAGSEDLVFSPIANRRFVRGLDAALKERGYISDCSEPDFRVRFHTAKKNVNRLDFRYPNNAMRFHAHCFQPNVGFFPPPYIDRYQEGIFLIDIIDAQSKELVWRGTYVERLQRQPHEDEEVRTIIDKILDRFPPEY
ncbi:MAG: hypothetical protein ACJAT5_000693 [Lentimonas sp.]|jgi:hypothetical protein